MTANAQGLRRVGVMLQEAMRRAANRDPLAWAKRLQAIDKAGGELPANYCAGRLIAPVRSITQYQRESYREALERRPGMGHNESEEA